jgi:hypothetical protein
LAGWINQHQRDVIDYLRTENRVLREQLGPRRLRYTDDQRSRLGAKAKNLRRRVLQEIGTIVSPDTLVAWHRHVIARNYGGSHRRGPGRPPVAAEIRQLIVRRATDNRDWGYRQIQGALANVGHDIGRGTIATILEQHGIEPAPERQKRTTWQEFLKAHWDVLAAADFFSVEVWTATGLTRYAVLFVIELATRRVQIAGIASEPDSAWVIQGSRQLTDAVDGFLVGKFPAARSGLAVLRRFGRRLPQRVSRRAPPPTLTTSERVRRALRTKYQGIVSEPGDSGRRMFITTGGSRVRRA